MNKMDDENPYAPPKYHPELPTGSGFRPERPWEAFVAPVLFSILPGVAIGYNLVNDRDLFIGTGLAGLFLMAASVVFVVGLGGILMRKMWGLIVHLALWSLLFVITNHIFWFNAGLHKETVREILTYLEFAILANLVGILLCNGWFFDGCGTK